MRYSSIMILFFLFLLSSVSGQTDGSVSFTVKTLPKTGAQFSPRHVFAMWVEDNQSKLVKNLELDADKRKQYLYTWNARSGGNSTDITSGATLSSHVSHTKTWNCRDKSGNLVADGTYKILTEFTSEHAQGPLNTVSFLKSSQGITLNPTATTYFTDINLVFTPANANGVITERADNFGFEIYPNPVSESLKMEFSLDVPVKVKISLYNLNMQLISMMIEDSYNAGPHSIQWNPPAGLANGSYLVILQSDRFIALRKVILSR
jgi:flagellar hook assembly protein FlgD